MQSSYALIPRACNMSSCPAYAPSTHCSQARTRPAARPFFFLMSSSCRRTTAGLLFVSLFFFFFQSSLNSSTFAASTSHGSTHGLSRIRVLDPSAITLVTTPPSLRTALHGSDRVPAAMLEVKVGDNHVHRFEVMPWDGLHPQADPGLHSEFVAFTGKLLLDDWSHPSSDHHDASFLFRRSTELGLSLIDAHFTIYGDGYHITQIAKYNHLRRRHLDASVPHSTHESALVMYQSSDRTRPDSNATNYVCGSDSLPTVSRDLLLHADPLTSLQSHSPFQMLMRRQTAPRGCPTSKKIVYTGVALDCTYITKHGSVQAARERALSNFLSVSNLFSKQFNMQIGVLDVVAFPQCNDTSSPAFNVPCSPAFDMGDRLSAFSQWRGTRQDGAGLWHLYTACSSGSTIGLAWLNMVCNSRAFSQAAADGSTEYVSGTGVTASPPSLPPDGEWLITAHEIGHNMGGRHDCTPNTDCSSGGSNLGCCSCATAAGGACNACSTSFVMNPVTRVDSPQFSPCSANEICSRYGVLGTCFADPGTRPVVSISQCGNGIVEDGEQCDCGGRDGCANNACCNTNCTLKAGATCDDKSDECCRSCQIVSNSTRTMCRPSRGECDRPEFCDGTSKLCPKDEFAPNGNMCQLTGEGVVGNVTTGTCASGQCTTRDQQCILRSQVAGVNATDIDEIMGECPNLFTGQCMLFCRSNVFGCRPLSGSFLDGTPCGKKGMCFNGECSDADLVGGAIEWISRNWIVSAIIGLVLLCALGFLFNRFCRCSQKRVTRTGHHPSQSRAAIAPMAQPKRNGNSGSQEILMADRAPAHLQR